MSTQPQALADKVVDAGDGRVISFPGSMPDEHIVNYLRNEKPTQFENERQQPSDSAWERLASGAKAGLSALNPLKGGWKPLVQSGYENLIPGAAFARPLANAVDTYQHERASGQGMLPSIGSAIGEQMGLDTQGIKERAQRGDVAGVIGEGLPSIAGTLITPEVKSTVGRAARFGPGEAGAGELKPWTKAPGSLFPSAARIPAISNPEWLPEHPNVLSTSDRALVSRIPNRAPKIAEPETGTPENPVPGAKKEFPHIVEPGSAPPEMKVTYQDYSGPELQKLMNKGDVNAMREFVRNPRPGARLPVNSQFLLERGASKPWRNLEK
jgi:hypothetical protein